MSDTLSAINSVVNLITGQNPVTLGSFTFQSFEVPSRVQSGTAQRKSAHRFPGGQRTLDANGYDPADITWSGMMLGPNALARRTALAQIVAAGEIVDLHWGTIECQVLPDDVTFDEGYSQVEYRITCTVLPDPTGQAEPSPTQSLLDDVGSSLGLDLSGALATVQPYLATAQNVLQGVSGIIPGASVNLALSSVLNPVNTISQGVQAAANGNLAGLATSFSSGQYAGLLSAGALAANSSAVAGFAGRALNTLKAS